MQKDGPYTYGVKLYQKKNWRHLPCLRGMHAYPFREQIACRGTPWNKLFRGFEICHSREQPPNKNGREMRWGWMLMLNVFAWRMFRKGSINHGHGVIAIYLLLPIWKVVPPQKCRSWSLILLVQFRLLGERFSNYVIILRNNVLLCR